MPSRSASASMLRLELGQAVIQACGAVGPDDEDTALDGQVHVAATGGGTVRIARTRAASLYDAAMAVTRTLRPPSRAATRWRPTRSLPRGAGAGRHQWKELYEEVITSGLCTGCAGCVIACPHDVIGYDHDAGRLQAVPPRGGARARPTASTARRAAPPAPGPAPASATGSPRPTSTSSAASARPTRSPASTERHPARPGQPTTTSTRSARTAASSRPCSSGLLDEGYIDGALVSYLEGDGSTWKAKPGVATTKEEVLAVGRQPLHLLGQHARPTTRPWSGASRTWPWSAWAASRSVPPVMWTRKVGKVGKPIKFNIGLLCSKTFDDAHLRGALRGQVRHQAGATSRR